MKRIVECEHPFEFIHGHGNWPKEIFIGGGRLWKMAVARNRAK